MSIARSESITMQDDVDSCCFDALTQHFGSNSGVEQRSTISRVGSSWSSGTITISRVGSEAATMQRHHTIARWL